MNDNVNLKIDFGQGMQYIGYTNEPPIPIDSDELLNHDYSDSVKVVFDPAATCTFKVKKKIKITKQFRHEYNLFLKKEIIKTIEYILQNVVKPPVYGRINRYRMKQLGIRIVVDNHKRFYGILYKGSIYQFDKVNV